MAATTERENGMETTPTAGQSVQHQAAGSRHREHSNEPRTVLPSSPVLAGKRKLCWRAGVGLMHWSASWRVILDST